MGNLLLYSKSIQNLSEDKVDLQLNDFIQAYDASIVHKDHIYREKLIDSFQFSFGNFFNDLVYAPDYSHLKKNRILKNINQVTFQQLQNLFYKFPAGSEFIEEDEESFVEKHSATHFGFLGIDKIQCAFDNHLKVFSIDSWIGWHSMYLSINPEKIDWSLNDFLPNRNVSNYLLAKESLPTASVYNQGANGYLADQFCNDFSKRGISQAEKVAIAKKLVMRLPY